MNYHVLSTENYEVGVDTGVARRYKTREANLEEAKASGGYIYLHTNKKEGSFMGGPIKEYRPFADGFEIVFKIDKRAIGKPWPSKGGSNSFALD